ncbi:MAG: alpha/beta fold hydrolase [Novosphingobium sp.]
MTDEQHKDSGSGDSLADLFKGPVEAAKALFGPLMPNVGDLLAGPGALPWADMVQQLQAMRPGREPAPGAKPGQDNAPDNGPGSGPDGAASGGAGTAAGATGSRYTDLAELTAVFESWARQLPIAEPERKMLWTEGLELWQTVLGRYGVGATVQVDKAREHPLPRSDPRFADPAWIEQPFFALLHQTYLLLSEKVTELTDQMEGLEPAKKEQLQFSTRAIFDALSPANFPMTNPAAIDRAVETRGESLVKGMEYLLADLQRGQLTHTESSGFKLGENLATTPGKVVHETPLYQLIQYAPATETVLTTPLVIFPSWINRFYILDLNPKKSFVRWAVEQGITVFMVSWKSADKTMGDVIWDDYIAAQIDAVDTARARLGVASAHVIGYCVAGTTLAATLAVLARKGEAERIASATMFAAQVDFEEAGELKLLVGNQASEVMSPFGRPAYVDGRQLAHAFNLLRGNDLIWSYVAKHYLMGEDYPAFDLLHWNGDVTNLPARWHRAYISDLYRDNRLAKPDSLSACGVPLDLTRIETPCYVQAGRDDHIAPAQSVWKMTRHVSGPCTFVLAGSGHVAGVVNPPAAGKYQYWTNDDRVETLDEFTAGATEHPGSWWPHWLAWLRAQDPSETPALGKRSPGEEGDAVIEDAPGRYVLMR